MSTEHDMELLTDNAISNVLSNQLGIPQNIKGYYYLIEAIKLYSPGQLITKEVYPKIAKKFNTKIGRVERAIRHAVQVKCNRSWEWTSINKGYATNSEFISYVRNCILNGRNP